uniref:Cpc-1 n=1 Tax=Neurospora crassa TaxID=5141 RepID=Q01363_NEUCS|nr:open reading frame 2 [Neurospora crassa]
MASLQFTEPAGTLRAITSTTTTATTSGLCLVRSADQTTPST